MKERSVTVTKHIGARDKETGKCLNCGDDFLGSVYYAAAPNSEVDEVQAFTFDEWNLELLLTEGFTLVPNIIECKRQR